jgi:uncharacterized protein
MHVFRRRPICRLLWLAIFCLVSTFSSATSPCPQRESPRANIKTDRELLQVLRAAADGDRDAQFRTGLRYETGCGLPQNFAQAAQWYRKAAENGHPAGQNNLGRLYLLGVGVRQSDAEAMKWYLRAASEGFAPAQGRVPGDASTGDESLALKWYRKAAEGGSAAGELNLGLGYFNGTSIRQDLGEAVKWFRKAAAHGSAEACDQLGRAYRNGTGAPHDEHIAKHWYNLAIQRGYMLAQQDLAALDGVEGQAASELGMRVPNP